MKSSFSRNSKFNVSWSVATLLMAMIPLEHVSADDVAVVKHLESLGGKVVMVGGSVVELSFRDSSKLGDSEWQAISSLSGLRKLTTYNRAHGLNDETVGYLSRLKKLESLSTDGAQLSDTGLAKLADVTSLRFVAFFHLSSRKEGFTGKGFSAWKKLPNLERLTVAGMSMGDDGFVEIGQLKTLRELRTWHTYRTEASHAEIAKLPELTSLKLGQRLPRGSGFSPCLTNNSLSALTTIRTLESLEIGEARFLLAALRQLRSLPKLKRLKIDRTEISADEIDHLRAELSGVEVEFEPLTDDQQTKLNSYLK